MTPREVLASWSGWGTTTHGDTVADDIIATLAAHGYEIVSRSQELEHIERLMMWTGRFARLRAQMAAVLAEVEALKAQIPAAVDDPLVDGYRIVGEGQAVIGGEVVTLLAAPVVCIAGGDDGQERITLRVPPGTWDRLGRPLGEDGTVSYIAEEAS